MKDAGQERKPDRNPRTILMTRILGLKLTIIFSFIPHCVYANDLTPVSARPDNIGISLRQKTCLFPVKIDGKWGYIDHCGRLVVKPKFEFARGFSEGLAPVNFGGLAFKGGLSPIDQKFDYVAGGKWGFINTTGEVVIPAQYDGARGFDDGLATVNIGSKETSKAGMALGGAWGVIDKTGKLVIPARFNYWVAFGNGLAAVNEGGKQGENGLVYGGKWGFIDANGTMVIKPEFDMAFGFSEEDLGSVNIGAKVIHRKFAFKGEEVSIHSTRGGKWGFIDKQGKYVIEPKFENLSYFTEGLAAVKDANKWGYIDHTWSFVIPPKFRRAQKFSEGLAAVLLEKNGKSHWAYIDRTGKVAISLNANMIALPFSEGMAIVAVRKGKDFDSLMGYIDKTGEIVIPLQFDEMIFPFQNGLARVTVDGKIGYIDKTGKWVWKPTE